MGDVYKEMASSVFGVPVDQVDDAQRFIGKTLVLGSGYGLGWAGLQRNLKANGRPVEDIDAKKYTWAFRAKFDRVVRLWSWVIDAFWTCYNGQQDTEDGKELTHLPLKGLRVRRSDVGIGVSVYVELPTGKKQWYHDLKQEELETPWGEMQTSLTAANPRGGRYTLTASILIENICSATAREIMGRAMVRLQKRGYPSIMTVHDELVMEVSKGFGSDAEVIEIMTAQPPWSALPAEAGAAELLPLAVELHRAERYGK